MKNDEVMLSLIKDFLIVELNKDNKGNLYMKYSCGTKIDGNYEIIKFIRNCFNYKIGVNILYEIDANRKNKI